VVEWCVRDIRLHGKDDPTITINIKLDGRPFWGKKNFEFFNVMPCKPKLKNVYSKINAI